MTAAVLSAFAVAAPVAGADHVDGGAKPAVIQSTRNPALIVIKTYGFVGKTHWFYTPNGESVWRDYDTYCDTGTIAVSASVGSVRFVSTGDADCGVPDGFAVAGVEYDSAEVFSIIPTASARKTRKKLNKIVKWEVTYNGEVIGSGRLRLTTQFVPAVKSISRRIWADTNRDSFYNYCLNGGKKTYSSGGRIYCWYWKAGVRSHWNDKAVELTN